MTFRISANTLSFEYLAAATTTSARGRTKRSNTVKSDRQACRRPRRTRTPCASRRPPGAWDAPAAATVTRPALRICYVSRCRASTSRSSWAMSRTRHHGTRHHGAAEGTSSRRAARSASEPQPGATEAARATRSGEGRSWRSDTGGRCGDNDDSAGAECRTERDDTRSLRARR